jgi:chromosome segregation ATPase
MKVYSGSFQKIFSQAIGLTKMIKQIERQVRGLQKELAETQKERNLLRLQPCQGDLEIRQKEERLDSLDTRIESLNQQIRELEKKRREMMSEAIKKPGYESPFS